MATVSPILDRKQHEHDHGRCAADAPAGLIEMVQNLPVVDYTRRHETRVPIQRCPTGAIVWLDTDAGPSKGPAARKIVRKSARPEAPTCTRRAPVPRRGLHVLVQARS